MGTRYKHDLKTNNLLESENDSLKLHTYCCVHVVVQQSLSSIVNGIIVILLTYMYIHTCLVPHYYCHDGCVIFKDLKFQFVLEAFAPIQISLFKFPTSKCYSLNFLKCKRKYIQPNFGDGCLGKVSYILYQIFFNVEVFGTKNNIFT